MFNRLSLLCFVSLLFIGLNGCASVQILKANHYLQNEQYAQAIYEYDSALKQSHDKASVMMITTNMGVAYTYLDNFDKAKEYYLKSINAWPERGYYGYINLAGLFYKQGKIQEALEFSLKAMELANSPRFDEIEKSSYYNKNTLKWGITAASEFYKLRSSFQKLTKEYELGNYSKASQIANGILRLKYHPHFGVDFSGNTIVDVQEGSIADLNGLVKGDKILRIDGISISTVLEAYDTSSTLYNKYGKDINISILRHGRELSIVCRLTYPEIDQTRLILSGAKSKSMSGTTTAKSEYTNGPFIKILEPKSARGIKILTDHNVTFIVLASGKYGIKSVTINGVKCRTSEANELEQSFLPSKVIKYTAIIPLLQKKNTFTVKALDTKGNITQEQVVIEGNQSFAKEFANIYDHKVAVIIGINKYKTFPSLEFAVNDAKSIRDTLKTKGFDKIIELYDGEASRARIMRILADELPSTMGKNDALMVYFAGHGLTEDLPDEGGQEGYIAPMDTDVDNYRGSAISMTYIHNMIKKYRAKHILFVFDSCYSGLGLMRNAGTTKKASAFIMNASQNRSTQILTAGGKNEQSKEEKGHGLFTRALLDALNRKTPPSGDSFIVASDIAQTVRKKVAEETNGEQNPMFGWLAGEGDFIFESF